MGPNQGERDEGSTVVSNLEFTFRDGCRTGAASSTVTPFGNLAIASQSSEVVVKTVDALIPRAESKDIFARLAVWHLLKKATAKDSASSVLLISPAGLYSTQPSCRVSPIKSKTVLCDSSVKYDGQRA